MVSNAITMTAPERAGPGQQPSFLVQVSQQPNHAPQPVAQQPAVQIRSTPPQAVRQEGTQSQWGIVPGIDGRAEVS